MKCKIDSKNKSLSTSDMEVFGNEREHSMPIYYFL
jgi:hypothetical protein